MPHQPRPSTTAEAPSVTSYGQVIEYIAGAQHLHDIDRKSGSLLLARITNMYVLDFADRLYLAAYTHAPDESTPFPYPQKQSRSPSKRSARAQQGPQSVSSGGAYQAPFYFSIDRSLLYNAFHADFGPLHIGHLYRFAVQLHDVLGNPENESRPVVFWSNADSRSESPPLPWQPPCTY